MGALHEREAYRSARGIVNTVRFRILAAVLAAGFAATACTSEPEDYGAKIAAARAAKDEGFKNDPDSPVPADKKAELLAARVFPDR